MCGLIGPDPHSHISRLPKHHICEETTPQFATNTATRFTQQSNRHRIAHLTMASVRAIFRPASASARTFSTSARYNYAKLAVIGRLAGAPEAHASSTGRTYIKYALATSHGSRDNERTSWWNVTSFPTSDAQKDYLLNLPKGYVLAHGSL